MMREIILNNGQNVIDLLSTEDVSTYEGFFTMLQGNSFNGADITEENIDNNSQFIADLWD